MNKGLRMLFSPSVIYALMEPFFKIFGFRKESRKSTRIVVIRLDEIGDVVLTSPFLRSLRQSFPQAFITLIVKPEIYNLVEHCPYVNEILVFDRRYTGVLKLLKRFCHTFYFSMTKLWRRKFNLALIPRAAPDDTGKLLSYLSGASQRAGFTANSEYDRFLTIPVKPAKLKHQVEHTLELLKVIGGKVNGNALELWLTLEDQDKAFRSMDGDSWIAFSAGAGHPSRCWPPDNYYEVGVWLINQCEGKILAVGSSAEKSVGAQWEQCFKDRILNVVGKTTIREAAAMLKRCRLYIGNDTGPMHLAAAGGVPVLEISVHPENGDPDLGRSPIVFGPWNVPSKILQCREMRSPCGEICVADEPHCIKGVLVEDVKKAVTLLLEQTGD